MSKLQEYAAALLEEGKVKLIIGHEQGTSKTRPLFAKTPADAKKLILSGECHNNNAVYLTRKELIGDGPIGMAATYHEVAAILQLSKENQIDFSKLQVFVADKEGNVLPLADVSAMEKYLAENEALSNPKIAEQIEKIEKMTREERWQYWKSELSKCIRCYACRAACPLCYCNRCIVEVNCPQWLDPWPSASSNMEWQINRVMHMSGRCVGCGACADACPLDLPIGILTKKMANDITQKFGNPSDGNVLSIYNPNDKENFIH